MMGKTQLGRFIASSHHPIISLFCAVMAAALAACSRDDRAVQPAGGYAGSAACLSCHAKRDAELVRCWQASRHHKTLTILQDAEQAAREFGLQRDGARKAFAVIGSACGPRVVLGRDLKLIASLGWEDEDVFGPPHEILIGTGWRGIDAAESCLGCHSTGYSVSRRTVLEAGIGCEACHGPGGRHVDSAAGTCETVNPVKLDLHRANMVCGQCHSRGTDKTGRYPFPVKSAERSLEPFIPGDDLAACFTDAKPLRNGQGWEYSLLINAAERYANQRCTDCHDSHNKPGTAAMLKDPTSEQCLTCHGIGNQRLLFENHWGLGNAIEKPCWQCHKNTHSH